MSVEENLRLFEQVAEVFNAKDWDRLVEYYDESVVRHQPDTPEPLEGPEAIIEYFEDFFKAFPDFNWKQEQAFGQGDWICVEGSWKGTHRGSLMGPGGEEIPATNKVIQGRDCIVMRIEKGKAVEIRDYFDVLSMMTQLGLAQQE